ncbi:MAG: acyltransferase [Prevotellaceae bacterium]|jgi:peptidoglycan/LPS O-acetylase OafA/YrhL|nr:acyltransferase [Prevotellaceae bacterium]
MSQAAPIKPHYAILDGLRGVAAVVVVAFHLCEAHSTTRVNEVISHGYLAVDLFFVLSGFVIGYAYDDRWGKMGVGQFFRRRLARLHPLVVLGMALGAVSFYFQDSAVYPVVHGIPLWQMLGVMLIGMTLLPVPPSMNIRGWVETHPLNGPAWTLFFEYLANILYALVLRRLSKTALAALTAVAGAALVHFAVTSPVGDIEGGWSLTAEQLRIGFTRLMFPFCAGLLLSRVAKPGKLPHAFGGCSLLVVALLAMPRLGGSERLWVNGLYDALAVTLAFPLIVYWGASGEVRGKYASRLCKLLGDLSYPLYITHYPLIYLYNGWVSDTHIALSASWPVALLILIGSAGLAYAALKLYDEPVRRWLGRRRGNEKTINP